MIHECSGLLVGSEGGGVVMDPVDESSLAPGTVQRRVPKKSSTRAPGLVGMGSMSFGARIIEQTSRNTGA